MNNELFKRILSSLILLPISLFCIIKGQLIFNFFIILIFLISCYEWHNLSKNKSYYLFGFIFLSISFLSVFLIRQISFEYGLKVFLFIILVCIFTDVGGYAFGKILKGPKLIKISPGKTYAGMIGGFACAIIVPYIFNLYYFIPSEIYISHLNIYLLVFLLSSVSQLGDLVISYFKRVKKIKNTGSILPGHGGILDRIDGMIFVFPFYFLISL